jgi:hypothetical protein
VFQLCSQAMNGEAVPLPSGELVLVGRGDNCGLTIEDPSASRVHCRLLARDGKVFLTDAGSRWGTLVNGRRIADCELRPGDEITIGETVLRLEATGTPAATTLARRSEIRGPLLSDEQPEAWPTSPKLFVAGPETREPPPNQPAVEEAFDQKESMSQPVAAESRLPAMRTPGQAKRGVFTGGTFAGCRVKELVARTTSGEVFLATVLATQQDVALKVFDSEMVRDETAQRRFTRAFGLMRGLRHPHLVALLDAGVEQGRCYTVSEFVAGESAATMIQRIGIVGMLDWRTSLRIGCDIAAALEFASEQGIVHRNVTPRNILIRSENGAAMLNDLLLARTLVDDTAARLTQPGELLGTIPFLSPEQVGSGQFVDQRSDLYQLGATLYALLTGKPPVAGRNTAEVVQNILSETPPLPKLTHLAIPALLEGVIMRLLEKRPDDRFASPLALQRELSRVSRYLGESVCSM